MNYGAFSFIATFLRERAGLILTPDKTYVIENNLRPIVRELGLDSVDRLVSLVRTNPKSPLAEAVVHAMTSDETLFFRDSRQFEELRRNAIPALMARRRDRKVLRVWSAACSSGQEPYSLAMMLHECAALDGWYINIIATDANASALLRARDGAYSGFEVLRGLPMRLLVKYFDRQGERWRIKASIREMVEFHRHDLRADSTRFGEFDIVMCRNVLFLLDQAARVTALTAIHRQLAADGLLLLGDGEAIRGLTDMFSPVPEMNGFMCRSDDSHWLAHRPVRRSAEIRAV